MQLSVVILNYNVRFFLEQCLLSVQAALSDIDSEIIVVDNNSKDDSCQMVKELFPEVILIENKENTGFPKGNNIGVARAKGKYLCILNPDTVVAEDTFAKLLNFSKSKENLGIVGCKLIDGTGNFLPESKRNIPTPNVSLLKMLGNDKKYYASHVSENEIGKVNVFVGAFMFVETEKYLAMNGFDEDFFMYGEDIDLSFRFVKKGFDNYYFGETTVIHYKGESTIKDKEYLNRFYGAMKLFYKKHYKSNFLFDFVTIIGIKLFSFLSNFKSKSTEKTTPKKYVLVSNDEFFHQSLSESLVKETVQVKSISELTDNELKYDKIEVIFDNSCVTFREIINYIQKHKNTNYTFKIRPKNTYFAIGSNSSRDKGEVILFK